MHACSVLVFSALLCISLTAQAQVYESTGEDGSVTYSDQPTPDSQEIVVPETNVGDSVEVPPPAPEPEPEPEVVVEEIPEAPQGELYVKDNDDNNNRWRKRPKPKPHRDR